MKHVIALVALLATASPTGWAPTQPHESAIRASSVSVHVNRTRLDGGLGDRFTFTSVVQNPTGRQKQGLIAHLNIFSTDTHTYVDPEDWSSNRTQFLHPLSPHGSTSLTWTVQAVNSGPLVLYVAVTDISSHTVTASEPIQLTVSRQKSIDSAGILPLAVAVPAVVAALLVILRLRRRRLSA